MQSPPKLPLRILRWFCNEERLEELEGDLYELYQEACERRPRTAKLDYYWMTLRSFRFYALKNSKQSKIKRMIHFIIIMKHQLKLIFRQLWQQKVTTAINIVGLTIGLAGFITLYSLVRYEFNFNQHIPDSERIYRLYTQHIIDGEDAFANRGSSAAMGRHLRDNPHQEVEQVTHFITKTFPVKTTESKENDAGFKAKSLITDSRYFQVFSQYDWLAGDKTTALSSPHQVVLTIEQAEKYFGPRPLDQFIGRQLTYSDSLQTIVTGIVQQQAGNTDFIWTDFVSLATVRASWLKDKINMDDLNSSSSASQVWVKTPIPLADVSEPAFLDPINQIMGEVDKYGRAKKIKIKPLSGLHSDQELYLFDNSGRSPADLDSLSILSVVCVVLLLMALFNFVSLETASASGKAKEVGIKKVLGSNRTMIFSKFILQSMVLVAISLLLAFPLTQLSYGWFSEYFPNQMEINLLDQHYILLTFLLIAVVGILAGLYPALRISGVSINLALKSNVRLSFATKSTPLIRKILVSFQFICSQVLIIVAIGIFFQISFMTNKDMGFNTENIMYFYMPRGEEASKAQLLHHHMTQIPAITETIWQDNLPAGFSWRTARLQYEPKEGEPLIKLETQLKIVDTTYLDFYQIPLLEGRMFHPRPNLREIVVNEEFLSVMGITDGQEALGVKVGTIDRSYTIVGVMSDFHQSSLRDRKKPMMLIYSAATNTQIAFKTRPEDAMATINQLTDVYREIYPESTFSVEFVDDTIMRFYRSEKKLEKLSMLTTTLAILISCLGLFGLIAITVIQKTKEIGIRKVLGAGLLSLSKVISKEFLSLIVVALVIATPISYLILENWLENYAYRAPLGWWLYLLGGLCSFTLAFLAVGWKVYKAIVSDPVDSLRYE